MQRLTAFMSDAAADVETAAETLKAPTVEMRLRSRRVLARPMIEDRVCMQPGVRNSPLIPAANSVC
jgi:hypothetical protein